MNFHDVFAYECPKTIVVKDARLGLIYYGALVGIFWYVLIEIAENNVWMDKVPARAVVNLKFKEPTRNKCGPMNDYCLHTFQPLELLSYCCHEGCWPQIDAALNTFGRCSCPGQRTFSYECQYLDGFSAAHISEYAIHLVTYRRHTYQSYNESCLNFDDACAAMWISTNESEAHFTADFESFTLFLDHTYFEERRSLMGCSGDMEGYIEVGTGTSMQRKLCEARPDAVDAPYKGKKTNESPCYIHPDMSADNRDKIQIAELLQAIGVDLNRPAYSGGDVHSLRARGFTVIMEIHYFNTRPWAGLLKRTYYFYRLIPLLRSGRGGRGWSTIPEERLKERRILQMDIGITIVVTPRGFLGSRNLMNLLHAIAVVFALLGLVEYVMRTMVTALYSRRAFYYDYMYQLSADFAYLQELDRFTVAQITNALRRRNLDTEGNHNERMFRLLENGWRPGEKVHIGGPEIQMTEVKQDVHDMALDESADRSQQCHGKKSVTFGRKLVVISDDPGQVGDADADTYAASSQDAQGDLGYTKNLESASRQERKLAAHRRIQELEAQTEARKKRIMKSRAVRDADSSSGDD